MSMLCTPQASEAPACGRFCGYSSLSPLKQQGLEPFSTAFAQANTHQENKSKWHLQNQMPMPHAS